MTQIISGKKMPALNNWFKLTLFFVMLSAFIFGFMDQLTPKNFERLHIFLFNLCGGCSLILHYTETKYKLPRASVIFFPLSIGYAVLAFFELYFFVIIISIILTIVVEVVRRKAFSFFPKNFFASSSIAAEKFHHASLLCLTLTLILSSLVIINNEYFPLIIYPKLKLDVFFLGYSFPISLITMSIMFSFIQEKASRTYQIIENISFWIINLGVLFFFVFIILEIFSAELSMAGILSITVILIFAYFFRYTDNIQQKKFLTSGMCFLLSTAITGLLYIVIGKILFFEEYSKVVLKMHAFLSLYGWNLSGLFIIIRWEDFPLRFNATGVILFHWFIILILALLGKYFLFLSIIAVICYLILLMVFFVSK